MSAPSKKNTAVGIPPPPSLSFTTNLAVSGVSGTAAWLFTHPFELLKNRILLSPAHTPFQQVVSETRKGGWYKGIEAGILRQVVYATCRLGLYEPFKNVILTLSGDPTRAPTVLDRALAGASAGCFASFLSSPIEVCLVLMTKKSSSSSSGGSILNVAKTVYTNAGVLGFWRGSVPLMVRASIVGVSQVAMFDQCKTIITRLNDSRQLGMGPMALTLSSSAITGLFYAFVTMPVEFSRVTMSSATAGGDKAKKYSSMFKTIRVIWKEEGLVYMYRPFPLYYIRCSVHTILTFVFMDYMKHHLL